MSELQVARMPTLIHKRVEPFVQVHIHIGLVTELGAGWPAGWLAGWLAACWLAGCLGWLAWLAGQSGLAGWLADWLPCGGWLVRWLNGWERRMPKINGKLPIMIRRY